MLREIKCQGNFWRIGKMSQIARQIRSLASFTSSRRRLLSRPPQSLCVFFCTFFEICVCVSLCQCEERECVCVCEEIWGKLLERYHRVGGGRWSVSERAVRTCCPARLDSHPWNVSTQKKNAPPQQPPIYTAIFHSLATELNRICLPAVDTAPP